MQIVEKGWGHEEIFVSNELYCGKILHFEEGKKFSMHFHAKKQETWYVLEGEFEIRWINTEIGKEESGYLLPNSVWTNQVYLPHQLICISGPGRIIEVSTKDTREDNYRVLPGDSQK